MKRILVVDDNISTLKHVGAILANEYIVALATSGTRALSMCMRRKPDLILLDADMPGMNGFETMAELKLNPQLHGVPIVFMTDSRGAEAEVRMRRMGAKDFIAKPVETETFKHKIELNIRFAAFQAQLEGDASSLSESNLISIAELVERRDKNTEGHVARIGKYAGLIGRELMRRGRFGDELTDADLEMIERAAPLHDIGKIAISDNILLKPGKLSEKEFALMKRHAVIGAEVIGNMHMRTPAQHFLQFARMIALSHHERYDGNGYPYKLRGEEIPLCGRITAVADVYDSLLGNRIYKKGIGHIEACDIIMEGKGGQFDPWVVDAFDAIKDLLGNMAKIQIDIGNSIEYNVVN
ncbi:MAG: response regulator [Clostridiales Family XIII bacterium]|jgi:putative two-component system response regulator|nr:response regulator [Clostridiales Family XIII bacterium]